MSRRIRHNWGRMGNRERDQLYHAFEMEQLLCAPVAPDGPPPDRREWRADARGIAGNAVPRTWREVDDEPSTAVRLHGPLFLLLFALIVAGLACWPILAPALGLGG